MRIILELKALEPISVGFESIGTQTSLYRLPLIKATGEIIDVPVIPGNSLRGVFRDGMAIQFISDMKNKEQDLKVDSSTLMTFFSGGILARRGEEEINAKWVSELMTTYIKPLLPLSILGCALGKTMVPSKIKFGLGYPLTEETYEFLEDLCEQKPKISLSDILVSLLMMRKDDTSKISQLGIETDFSKLDEYLGEARERMAVQQRFTREAAAPGTLFISYIDEILPLTEPEKGLLFKTLNRFCHVGGSISRGLGRFRMTINYPSEEQKSAESEYQKFIETHLEEIKKALEKEAGVQRGKKS